MIWLALPPTIMFVIAFGAYLTQLHRAERLGRALKIERSRNSNVTEPSQRALLAHWCNEAIRLERALKTERAERIRWERAYQEKLDVRVN